MDKPLEVPCPKCDEKNFFLRLFYLQCPLCEDAGTVDYATFRAWQARQRKHAH